MVDPPKCKRPNATKAFFELEMPLRVDIAQRAGLVTKSDLAISDTEQSKLWITRARELGSLDTLYEAVWLAWDKRNGH